MKIKLLIMTLVIGVALSLGVMQANAGSQGEKGIVIGDAIELSTVGMKGLSADVIDEMKSRAGQGFPVGIIEEETGVLWICTYRSSAPASGIQPANEALAEYIGTKVVVQGLKYQNSGVNVIRFSNVSEY
ncbi:MAG: hypothetical protein VCD00_10455 [Candidatus Hydrogenedentota bacterium]